MLYACIFSEMTCVLSVVFVRFTWRFTFQENILYLSALGCGIVRYGLAAFVCVQGEGELMTLCVECMIYKRLHCMAVYS